MADDLHPQDQERHDRAHVWVRQVITESVPEARVRFSPPARTVPDLIGGIEYRMLVSITAPDELHERLADRLLGLNPERPPELLLDLFQVIVGPGGRDFVAVYWAQCR